MALLSPWKRTYWSVYAANLITAIGMMSFLPFFPSYLESLGVEDRGALATWTGVTFGAAPLAAAFMGPIWGSIGDRYSRKLMVLRAMIAITLFVGAMSVVRSPWELLALRLCQGVFSGFVPPSVTLVSVGAPADVQGRITGSLQGSLAVGSILGPLFGAFMQEHFGMRNVFLCVSVLAGTGALLVALFAHEDRTLDEVVESWSPTSLLAHAWSDLQLALSTREVRSALLVLFCVQFGMGSTNPQMELFVRDVWEGDPELVPRMTGFAVTAFALASLVAMPGWGRYGDRVGHTRALLICSLLGALVLGLHALATAYALVVGLRLILGLTLPGSNSTSFGVVATATPVERRGSAMGAAFSARAFAMSFGAMGGGALAGVLGLRGLFLASATMVLIGLTLSQAQIGQRTQDVVGMDGAGRDK
ncbi:MAG: MFS transporter [Planctomycetota bacterium]